MIIYGFIYLLDLIIPNNALYTHDLPYTSYKLRIFFFKDSLRLFLNTILVVQSLTKSIGSPVFRTFNVVNFILVGSKCFRLSSLSSIKLLAFSLIDQVVIVGIYIKGFIYSFEVYPLFQQAFNDSQEFFIIYIVASFFFYYFP